MSALILAWETPPGDKRGRAPGRMEVIAAELCKRPREWARIDVNQQNASKYAQRHPEIEVTTRSSGNARQDVYARYIGKEPSHD